MTRFFLDTVLLVIIDWLDAFGSSVYGQTEAE